LERGVKFFKPISHHTTSMLPYYLWNAKVQICDKLLTNVMFDEMKYLLSHGSVRTDTKKSAEIAPWVSLKDAKTCFIGSRSPAFTEGARGFFSVISPQTWTDLDETRNKSEWSRCTLTQKIRRKSPQRLHLRMQKRVLVFCNQYNADFRPLMLHRFWPLLK